MSETFGPATDDHIEAWRAYALAALKRADADIAALADRVYAEMRAEPGRRGDIREAYAHSFEWRQRLRADCAAEFVRASLAEWVPSGPLTLTDGTVIEAGFIRLNPAMPGDEQRILAGAQR